MSAVVSFFGRHLFSPYRRRRRLGPESRGRTWARLAVSLLSGALLATFIYGQSVYFIFNGSWFPPNGMLYLLRILQEPGLVWILALLSSATAAIALHLGSFLFWPGAVSAEGRGTVSRRPDLPGQDRLAAARDLTGLGCFAALNLLLVYRILTLVYFFDLRLLPLPPAFGDLAVPSDLSSWTAQPGSWLLLAGVLALAVAVMQAWRLLPAQGGRRAEPLLTLALALAVGLAATPVTPWNRGLGGAPSVRQDSRLRRVFSLLPQPDPEAVRALDLYQGTGLGTPFHHLPLAGDWYARRNPALGSDRPALDPGHAAASRALLAGGPCELPVIDVFQWRGVVIDLDRSGPSDLSPSAVVEIPREANSARLYSASDLRLTETRPLERIESWNPGGDWVILKADPDVQAGVIYHLLGSLRRAGVRRLTLAAIPGKIALERFENRTVDPPLVLLDEGDPSLPPLVELMRGAPPVDYCRSLLRPDPEELHGYPGRYRRPDEYLNLHIYCELPFSLRFPPLIRIGHAPLARREGLFYQQLVSMIEVATLHGGRELHLAPPP